MRCKKSLNQSSNLQEVHFFLNNQVNCVMFCIRKLSKNISKTVLITTITLGQNYLF